MKNVLLILLILSACAKESSVGPAKPSTFVRYFNGGNSDVAQFLLETPEKDLILLATTEITDPTTTYFKIKLIKTDAYGNLIWQKLYPDFANDASASGSKVSYKASGLALNPAGGYVIVGEDIQGGKSKQLIIRVDKDGNQQAKNTMNTISSQRKGISITVAKNGNFYVLSSIPETGSGNMTLGEFSSTKLDSLWTRDYSAGELINLSNKLFTDPNNNIIWSGTVRKQSDPKTVFRLTKTQPNSTSTNFDISPSSGFNESSNDALDLGGGTYGIIGESDEPGTSTVLYKKIIGTSVASSALFPINNQDGAAKGNALCIAKDGFPVLLATTKLSGTVGRGETDYCIIKTSIDASGKPTIDWQKSYGSKFEDVGSSIITTSDGGHVILGTTNLANVKTILLLKTDRNGNIE